MNISPVRAATAVLLGSLASLVPTVARSASTDLTDVPLVVQNAVKPNVLAVFDNSESMDAYMAGKLVTGTDPNTRGNIGRRVLRDTFTRYRTNFNWGLMSYGLQDQNPTLYNTYAYYFGDATTMVFTDDCVGGVSASNANRGCVANPQPFTGGNFVTYDRSGDDPDILDVLYINLVFNQLWAYTGNNTCFNEFFSHNAVNSWDPTTFTSGVGNFCYTPTDAGFTVSNPPYPRQFYVPRGYGYLSNITGKGSLIAPVQADVAGPTAYPTMSSALATETLSSGSGELKNAALYTPLAGTLSDTKTYFQSQLRDINGVNQASPIAYTCQRNFVMLVTDGAPTGKTDGNLYSATDRTNTYSGATWNFGQASQDAINAVTALRSVSRSGTNYDIQTYVIGMGDTVQNPSAVATLNTMAAAGGTTSAFLATNEAALRTSLDAVSQNIIAANGAAAAVTVSNPNIVAGDNASYESTYNSGSWTGDLQSYPVNITTGVIDHTSPNWTASAQVQLDSTTPNGRYIASYDGTQGIQFRPSTDTAPLRLTASAQTIFNSPTSPPGPSDSANVIAYVRGDRSNETTLYRTRVHLLGDLVDAEPVLVRAPARNYADACYLTASTGCTTPFKTAQASRQRVIFQGSNDGMLHAFSAASGAELWAYIPKLVWGSLNASTRLTSYAHQYRVDATPVAGDVDFAATLGSGATIADWHTMLVGGLGKGGRGYYALDVTNSVATSEADAAAKVMWEFPNATTSASVVSNIGYSYGRPILTKTLAAGWVVVVASGYNNDSTTSGDGQGHLFVLNAKTGALIRDIPTGAGTPTTPSGLARISAYSANASVNNTVDFVYGGDLLGNVWRFNLTDANPSNWNVVKLAALVDANGNAQAVTAEPQLAEITRNGISRRFVYVGTGKYLGSSDISTTQTQTMYSLIDDLSAAPLIAPLRASLSRQTMSNVTSNQRQVSAQALNYATQRGWYLDLTLTSGERINTDVQLASGALLFTTNIPSADLCVPGGSSWFYAINYETGGVVSNTTQPNFSAVFLGNALASRPALVQLPNGSLMAPIHLSDGTSPTEIVPVSASVAGGRRVFWKEINTN